MDGRGAGAGRHRPPALRRVVRARQRADGEVDQRAGVVADAELGAGGAGEAGEREENGRAAGESAADVRNADARELSALLPLVGEGREGGRAVITR